MSRPPSSPIQPGCRLRAGAADRTAPDYGVVRHQGTGDWLLLHTVTGAGRIVPPGGGPALELGPGATALWRIGTYQDYHLHRPAGHWQQLWAHVQAADSWLPLLEWPERAPGLMWLPAHPTRTAAFRAALVLMVEEFRRGGALAEPLALNALERALLLAQVQLARPTPQLDPRLRLCLELLEPRPGHPPTVDELARRVGLSPSRLAHLFRARFGLGPAQWRDRERLRSASERLRSGGASVAEVAAAVGFASPTRFSIRFRQVIGCTPSAWRNGAWQQQDP